MIGYCPDNTKKTGCHKPHVVSGPSGH